MNKESLIFITKDALNRSYLPTYGNMYWKTPNLDQLANKGTVFWRYYTAAPSTIMSNMSMFTGKYAHESELSNYVMSYKKYGGETLFDYASNKGFECHIIWDLAWRDVFHAVDRYDCYGKNTQIHHLTSFRQGVGAHYIHNDFLQRDDKKTENVYKTITEKLNNIIASSKKVFVWLHVPHVINGRTGYGQDIDAFDHIVGIARNFFGDSQIYISADHGNMNAVKHKLAYGFDVYEPAILIPLIAPKINNRHRIDDVISNIDIKDIIFNKKISKRDLIYSDSTFFAQPNRKLALITKNYKYIYNKLNSTEELYDLRFDSNEECNLMNDFVYDIDRHVLSPLRELYFYPYWNSIQDVRDYFRNEKDYMWKRGCIAEELKNRIEYMLKTQIYYKIKKYIIK